MRSRLLLIACVLSIPALSPAVADLPATNDMRTEAGLRAELDRLEARYEAASVKLGDAVWETRRPGSVPAAAAAIRDEAYKELAGIEADPKLAEIIAYWMKRNTLTRDPTLTRRVVLWNKTQHVGSITLDPKLRASQEDLTALIASDQPMVDGKTTTRWDLQSIIASNPDPAARRRAWLTLAGPPVTTIKTGVWKLIRQRAVACQPIKEHWFHNVLYQAQDLEPYWTFNTMEILMKRTEPAWQELLASLKKVMNKEKLQPWDYDYAMQRLAADRGVDKILQTRFKQEKAVPSARALLESMGFDLSKIPLNLEVTPLTFPALFVPVKVPTDLRAAVNLPTGPGDMIPFYEEIFRAYARAAQAAFNRQAAPMMKGYPWIPGSLNAVYAEGIAAGFVEFLRDPLFLSRQMGLTSAEIDVFLTHEKNRRLLAMRRRLLSVAMEFTVYVNPDADLDDHYRDLATKAFGVDISVEEASVWRTDPMLASRPVYHQNLMIAESVGLALHSKLVELFGDDRLGSRKPAEWLIQRCYAPGENFPLQERLSRSIDGGFDFDALVKSLRAGSGAPAAK